MNAAAKLRQGLRYDADGNLVEQYVAADMNCDGVLNFGDINPFWLALSNPSAWHVAYPNCDILNGDINGDGTVGFGDINPFTILLSGAGAGAGGLRAEYTWDAENRLVRVTPLAPTAASKKVEFQHDYQGRRIEKRVYDWNVDDPNNPYWETTPAVVRRFVWSDWLLLMELDGLNDNAPVRKYTWGLDLAGQMGWAGSLPAGLAGAGGVGGLLAMQDVQDPNDPNDNLDYVYFYDAGGNVGQLVDLSHDPNDPAGPIVAKYEYDPYGNDLLDPNDPNVSGPYAGQNPFRFSTKYCDGETGLSYYGYRYYSPGLGRWISRDPIGERGGLCTYAYARNMAVNAFDPSGLCTAAAMVLSLPSRERSAVDYLERPGYLLNYLHLDDGMLEDDDHYVTLSQDQAARVMSDSDEIRATIDEVLRRTLIRAQREQRSDTTGLYAYPLYGSAHAQGGWFDAIGTYTYHGNAACKARKECDGAGWSVMTVCKFDFVGLDKYNFAGVGEPLDNQGVVGTIEDHLMRTFIIHFEWHTSAWGLWTCQ